jgi:hypothetical protein
VIAAAMSMYRNAGLRLERGTALVMSLVILLILTILGVTALSTTTLEEKMAGNMQEYTRAFEVAESGVSSALKTPGALNLNMSVNNEFPYTHPPHGTSKAKVATSFLEYGTPKRGSGYSAQYRTANFAIRSQGETPANAKVRIDQGIGQVMPRQ